MKGESRHQLEIFLSYGHPEEEICQRIVERLKARGHRVWFDQEEIKHGEDWRRKIEDGLERSQAVVSCLSKHSVRDPGVCLDELSIAVGVKGGNIYTVLLEPEGEVKPPASVSHLQWLDMSDWKERWGEPDFDAWFEAKMDQIIEKVESPESVQFAGEIDELEKRLAVDYSTSKQRALLRQSFVGRKWLTEAVEAWLRDPKGAPLCTLYGDPGVGKSAFAARYTHYNQSVAASLFLEYNQPHYRDARTVIMTLAYLLACRILDFRKALLWALERLNLSKLNDSELFDKLIVEPANKCIDGNRETMCIVIDGLDESSKEERNALAEVLSDEYVRRLPRWLRILVTSREVTEVMAPLEGAQQLTLHGAEGRNREDVRAYFEEMLEEKFGGDPAWPEALDALVDRSDGIFLYAQLVANGMRDDKMGIEDIAKFPKGLSAAFHRWFNWFFPDYEEFKRRYRLPLGMILASPEPLPKEELQRALDWGEADRDDFLKRIKVLLNEDVDDFGQPTVRFSHQYLTEWLSADATTQPHAVSRRDAIARMASAFYAHFKRNAEGLTAYESLHLADYLRQSGERERAEEVETDFDLFVNIHDAGNQCQSLGRLNRAMECFQRCIEMAEKLFARNDGTLERQALLAAYNNAANVMAELGNLRGAQSLCEKCVPLCADLVRAAEGENSPQLLEEYRVLFACALNLAKAKNMLGDAEGAWEIVQPFLPIVEQIARNSEDAKVTFLHPDLCEGYAAMAEIKMNQGDFDGAMELLEKGRALGERLVRERALLGDRRMLALLYDRIADIQVKKGRLKAARETAERSLDLCRKLGKKQDVQLNLRLLSGSYLRLGDIALRQGEPSQSLSYLEQGTAVAEQLTQKWGMLADSAQLCDCYECSALAQLKLGRPQIALELMKKSLALREKLVRERGLPEDADKMNACRLRIAEIMQAQDDPAGRAAAEDLQEMYVACIENYEQRVQKCANAADCSDLLSILYRALELPKLPTETRLRYANRGIEIAQALFERQPEDDNFYALLHFIGFRKEAEKMRAREALGSRSPKQWALLAAALVRKLCRGVAQYFSLSVWNDIDVYRLEILKRMKLKPETRARYIKRGLEIAVMLCEKEPTQSHFLMLQSYRSLAAQREEAIA